MRNRCVWQAEGIARRRNLGEEREVSKGEEQGGRGQPLSHTASYGVRRK